MSPSIRNMAAPLRKMGWGFLLLLIDLNMGYFDILPDFVGYIIVYFGLSRIGEHFVDFSRAKWFSLILIFCSLADIIFTPVNNNNNSFASIPLYAHLFGQFSSLINLIMLIFIFRGLFVLGKIGTLHDQKLQEVIRFRRNGLIGIQGLLMLIYPIGFNLEDPTLMALFFLGIIQLLFYVLFIILLFRIAKLFEKWKASISV